MDKLNRFNGWVAVLSFSCVVLGTLVQDPVINFERDSNDKYVISCCSIAIVLSIITIAGYLFTEKLVGSTFEASMGTIVCTLWCAAIALVMNPSNELAVESLGVSHVIRNTNLYFFTWASFLSSAFILASIAQKYLADVQRASLSLVRWYLFLIASVVVFGTATKLKDLTCGDEFGIDNDLCRTTKYAISLGVVSAGIAFVPIIWSHLAKVNLIVETVAAIIVTVFYCVGAAYITDISGPGSDIGNLYFSTWFGFGLSVLLTFECFKKLMTPEPTTDESQHPEVIKGQQGEGDEEEVEPRQQGGEEEIVDVDVENRGDNA